MKNDYKKNSYSELFNFKNIRSENIRNEYYKKNNEKIRNIIDFSIPTDYYKKTNVRVKKIEYEIKR